MSLRTDDRIIRGMYRARQGRFSVMTVVSSSLFLCVASSCTSPPAGATAAAQDKARADAKVLIDEGYLLKQEGKNRAALAKFEEACARLKSAALDQSPEYASCLDDQGSVQVRTGDYDKAEKSYYSALRTATAAEETDPRLVIGIRYRIGLVGRLKQLGIRCAEPGEPAADTALPYFPDVAVMQRELGALGPRVHSCAPGPPRPVTLKVTITGDGKPIMAEVRGAESGTDVGKCVEKRIVEAIPEADLPRFRACFRAFTYPFPVGDIPPPRAESPPPE